MQTPKQWTLEGFYQARARFLKEEAITNQANGRVICRSCGTRIKAAAVKIEIHEVGKAECMGNGEAFDAGIPYCPRCEPLPAGVGCVHA